MGHKLRYTIEGRITDTEAFTALAKRMVQDVESSEPGTLAYEWFASDDGHFIVHGMYADDAAFLTHFGTRQETGELDELMAACEIERVWLLTAPQTDAAREVAAQFGAQQFHGLGGVVR